MVLSMPHFPAFFFKSMKLEPGWEVDFSDFRAWGTQEDASTVVKYESYGRKHETFFKTKGLALEKAIDPRSEAPLEHHPKGTKSNRGTLVLGAATFNVGMLPLQRHQE